jgi:hypothetical protein
MCIFELEWIQKKISLWRESFKQYFTGIDSTFITIKHRIPAKRTDIFANCKETAEGGIMGVDASKIKNIFSKLEV